MKIAIVGAGAVGSYFACRLQAGGSQVTVVARGSRAAAISDIGLTVTDGEQAVCSSHPAVVDTPLALGETDCIVLCVKAYSVPNAVLGLGPLLTSDVPIVFVQNGIPWWYLSEIGVPAGDNALDHDNRMGAVINPGRIVGCVTYANVRTVSPGFTAHTGGNDTVFGAPRGNTDGIVEQLRSAFEDAAIVTRVSERIQDEIWLKLWGNLAFNPISALTGMTMDEIIADPATRPTVLAMMREGAEVATACGARLGTSIEQRLDTASKAGAFKTSMLQDVESNRRMEIDAIIGAVAAIGRQCGVATPTIDVVHGLLRQKARGLGLL